MVWGYTRSGYTSRPPARGISASGSLCGSVSIARVFTLLVACQGVARTWKMRQARLSSRYTTNWDELVVVA